MKTKKLTRAEKIAQGMPKPAQTKYELKRARERAVVTQETKQLEAAE